MGTWPHAPSKIVKGPGLYIITSGTYEKLHLFNTDAKLDLLQTIFFDIATEQGWRLEAWAFFSNHYHIVGQAPETDSPITHLVQRVHGRSSFELNKLDGVKRRKVWTNCWDTRLTFEKSYMARLAYVHNNPVKHGLVSSASEYRWCSASWFKQNGDSPFVESVLSFPTDEVRVDDDF